MEAIPARPGNGFTIVEILIGFFILSITFVSLGAYTSSQRSGLYKSSQLSDATQMAVTALEEMKRDLSDSAKFAQMYQKAGYGSVPLNDTRKINNVDYQVRMTVSRGPAQDYLLKVRAKAIWKHSHSVEFGVLIPGAATVL